MVKENKYTLVDRAKFCPIGRNFNVKMLPSTFVRLCTHHQGIAKEKKNFASVMHMAACEECLVGPFIIDKVDPVLVVADVEWFTLSEVDAIIAGTRSVVAEVKEVLQQVVSKMDVKESSVMKGQLKEQLLRVKVLLREVMDIVDFVYNDNVVEKNVQKQEIINIPASVESSEGIQFNFETASGCIQGMTEETFNKASAVYADFINGMSKEELSVKYKHTRRYIRGLLQRYNEILSRFKQLYPSY